MTRIDGLNPLSTSRTQHGAAPGAAESALRGRDGTGRAEGPQDAISLSNRGRLVADAARAVAEAPEVRAERVAEARAAIANGTYRSDAREIAARLVASGAFGLD